jgi:hypothetical protein
MENEYYQQVATEGRAGRIGGRRTNRAALQPSVQPEDIHPTSTVRLPGDHTQYNDHHACGAFLQSSSDPFCFEILIVIIILGVLAAIVEPQMAY